jgi:hypothetical protein
MMSNGAARTALKPGQPDGGENEIANQSPVGVSTLAVMIPKRSAPSAVGTAPAAGPR